MMIPLCVSSGGGFHENLIVYGLTVETKKFVGGLLGPEVEQ